MGITFTIVIVFASLMSWVLYQFVLKPFHLDYLQIVVFIGLVSLTVQGVDTVLRKVNPRWSTIRLSRQACVFRGKNRLQRLWPESREKKWAPSRERLL